ncbi:MAG: glycosyltransferase family 4 protein [Dehalococcoidia bacterium]
MAVSVVPTLPIVASGALPAPIASAAVSTAPALNLRRSLRLAPTTPAVRTARGPARLRIAIVTPEAGPGAGVPHYWRALAGVLSRQHEVHLFAGHHEGVPLPGVHVHRLPALKAGWFLTHAAFYAAANTRFALARVLRRRPFDLVLGIGALTPFADVATVHFVQAREQDLERRKLFPKERTRTGLASLDYALYSHAMSWIGRRFYKQTDALIVTISKSVKDDLASLEGAPLGAMVVVPNGVDVERFHPDNRERHRASTRAELGLGREHTAVLFVGNSWGRKGLRTAIEAIRGPEHANVRLVVVGDGVAAPFLDGLPADVVDRIIFAGAQSHEVERFYAAADVFILPTLYEPFGLVILEAMACGLPTIVSACAGAAEWLKDGVDLVLLQDPTDGEGARAALHSIVSDPAFAAGLAANGRRAAESLQWSHVAEQIVEAAGVRVRARQQLQEARAI